MFVGAKEDTETADYSNFGWFTKLVC